MNEILAKFIAMPIGGIAAWTLWEMIRVGRQGEISEQVFKQLWKRHRGTYLMTYPACFAGAAFPLWLYLYGGYENTDWRPAGLAFGMMIALPLAVVAIRTIPRGRECHAEFWRIYIHRYKIGFAGLAAVFSAFLILGTVALIRL